MKKSTDGTATPTTREERKRAGITVIPGKGPSVVGAPVMRSPIQAGISRLNPTMTVARPLFIAETSMEPSLFISTFRSSLIFLLSTELEISLSIILLIKY